MNNIDIRKATPNDIVPLALLTRITFREAFGYLFKQEQDLIDYFNASFSVEKLTEKLNDTNNAFWMVIVDGLPVGYAKLIKNSPSKYIDAEKVSELQRIYILGDFLNMKLGHKLQEAVFKEVQHSGIKYLWLSVFVDNPKAIRFYERYDYKHLGNHVFNVANKDFEFKVMAKIF